MIIAFVRVVVIISKGNFTGLEIVWAKFLYRYREKTLMRLELIGSVAFENRYKTGERLINAEPLQ